MQAAETITDIVQTLKMDTVLVKIAGIDLIVKEAQCHHSCRASLIMKYNRYKRVLKTIDEEGEPTDGQKPLHFILAYVNDSVICKKRPEHLRSVYKCYRDMCSELDIDPTITKVNYFGDILRQNFPEKLVLHSPKCRKSGVIVQSTVMAWTMDDESIKAVYDHKSSPEGQVTQAALMLRKALKDVQAEPLKMPLTKEKGTTRVG